MGYFVGLDVSVKETSVCVVDDSSKVISEQKVLTEPDNIITLLTSIGETYTRIGIEAGPLSQWLVNALIAADLPRDDRPAAAVRSFSSRRRACRSDAEALPVRRDRL